jgi:hypothetical protein
VAGAKMHRMVDQPANADGTGLACGRPRAPGRLAVRFPDALAEFVKRHPDVTPCGRCWPRGAGANMEAAR